MSDTHALVATRLELHRLAAHVMARRRFDVTGRLGLRASPGGFATPAFGEGPETVRLSGTMVVHEVGKESRAMPADGVTLGDLAAFVGVDLARPFSAGVDTPPLGAPDEPLAVDAEAAAVLAEWLSLGWRVLDAVSAAQPPSAAPATVQLWPEHFDAATDVGLPHGQRVTLGFSPGDVDEPEPYVYVSPWELKRQGDQSYWNAPFGALLRRRDALAAAGTEAAAMESRCRQFLVAGLREASAQ